MTVFRKTFAYGPHSMTLETGEMARQAEAAVVARMGDTVVICTACAAKSPTPGRDFFPLTVDFERGFGEDHGRLTDSVSQLIEAGAIGMNIEDSFSSGALRPLADQVKRIEVVRRAADAVQVPFFINARTDAYMAPDEGSNRFEVAKERGKAFLDAGADGFYPVLCEPSDIAALVSEVALPLNAFYTPKASLAQLAEWGVARVSLGPRLFHVAVSAMRAAAQGWMQGDDAALFPPDAMNTAEIGKLLGL